MDLAKALGQEWLEADGLGGFSMGTAALARTRSYHGLLVAAARPPGGRVMLAPGVEMCVEFEGDTFELGTNGYGADTVHPSGYRYIREFFHEPWPRWRFELPDRGVVELEILRPHELAACVLVWRGDGLKGARLEVRPLLAGRSMHGLAHSADENVGLAVDLGAGRVSWRPGEVGEVHGVARAAYEHAPRTYRQFLYREERARGFAHHEDLVSPGRFVWRDVQNSCSLVLAAPTALSSSREPDFGSPPWVERTRERERARRTAFPSHLERAADAYIVRRGEGRTVIAGYPWFADWGRDTFIALRGVCLAAGRLRVAGSILLEWSRAVSEGMLPNRFPDDADEPEYNSVDASLWFVTVVGELLDVLPKGAERDRLEGPLVEAALDILRGYRDGTRYGIGLCQDGLISAGAAGQQLTWMDARVGDHVITPRMGKPVEIQALWLNALAVGARYESSWDELRGQLLATFEARYFDAERGYCLDVVDDGHQAGVDDASLRPNQLFAVGGLPEALLTGAVARSVVDVVERRLWTPFGPRSLSPEDPAYTPRYEGGPVERDGAYHQGTVWPWLTGSFIEAWLRTRSDASAAKITARRRFLPSLEQHVADAGLGHVSEIVDADAPHRPRGAPFQAWSVGELLRVRKLLGVEVQQTEEDSS